MVVYIDDLAIFSNTREEHHQHLRKIFQRMRETQVYANKRKCFFQQKRVPYLGHYISEKGIEMDPKKISAVIKWPKITTITQLRGFLGLIGFYRKFIKDFANIALPLTKLLKESTTFNWTEEQDKAREILIKALTSG